MKKIVLFILSFFLIFSFVYAEEDLTLNNFEEDNVSEGDRSDDSCPAITKAELMKFASNVTITYEENTGVVDSDDFGEGELDEIKMGFLDVKIYNLNSKILVSARNDDNEKSYLLTYQDMDANGAVTMRRLLTNRLTHYTFKIRGTDECSKETLRTIKLTLPKYNDLSGLEMCSDIQDYYLCQRLVTYDIDPTNSIKKIEEYKKDLNEKNTSSSEGETGRTTRIIGKLSNNKLYVVIIILVIGFIFTGFIIWKRRSDR